MLSAGEETHETHERVHEPAAGIVSDGRYLYHILEAKLFWSVCQVIHVYELCITHHVPECFIILRAIHLHVNIFQPVPE